MSSKGLSLPSARFGGKPRRNKKPLPSLCMLARSRAVLLITAAYGGVNPAAMSKRLWNAVRVALFMLRKVLVSKRKVVADLNLMVKRAKLLKRALRNLLSHHLKQPRRISVAAGGLQEYEFSCSSSSSPVFFGPSWKEKRHHRLLQLPCINPPLVQQGGEGEEEEEEEEDEDEMVNGDGNGEVDDDAEEFIRRFYEQLRLQSRIQYLQYDQDMQFHEIN